MMDALVGFLFIVSYFLIAVCAKVWNRANLKIFASSEVKTCAASTATTNHLISIIFVVLESPR
jgi:L-asparagine transporter-like permease